MQLKQEQVAIENSNLVPIILLAYHFPPLGGVAVMRALRFSRYLREFGFEPLVVCVDPHPRSPEPRDPSLLQEVLPGVLVHRVPCFEPDNYRNSWDYPVEKIIRNLFKTFDYFLVPDDRALWIKAAAKAVCQVAQRHKAQLIWATAQPFSTLLAGLAASKQLNIPLVSDFRDDWTTSSALFRRNEPGRLKRERAQERAVLAHSSAIITVTPGIVEALQQRTPPLDSRSSLRPDWSISSRGPNPSKVHQILNGFDPAHYPEVPSTTTQPNGVLRFTHTGGIYQHRSPLPIFQLLKALESEGQKRLICDFYGRVDPDSAQLFQSPECPSCVHNHGFCSHSEIRQALVQSDINLLILERVERVEWLYTGKVFDYFGAKRPILMLGPVQSPLSDMVRESGLGQCYHWDDLEGQLDFVQRVSQGEFQSPNLEFLNQFDARHQTETLSNIFLQVLGKR